MLSPQEQRVYNKLSAKPDQIVNFDGEISSAVLKVIVCRLRRKLRVTISSVRGEGYVMHGNKVERARANTRKEG